MKQKAAEHFVAQMRQDSAFRTSVQLARDENELSSILRKNGFGFTMDGLARTMASCMDELDRAATNPSP